FVCLGDGSRGDGWPLIGWLDPPAFALALRFCKRIRIADHGDYHRLPLASRRKRRTENRISAGRLLPAARPAEPMARANRRIHRVFPFSSIFNYLPFYLSRPPFFARTEVITLMYLAYLIGIVTGPMSGRLSNRMGSGVTIVLGSVLLAAAGAATLIPSLAVIAVSLVLMCASFSSMHAAAIGLLNRRLTSSQGRDTSLYVLCYY